MNFCKNVDTLREYSPGRSRPGYMKLSSNENPLGSSPAARKILTENLSNLNVYPHVVPEELRQGIADWRGVRGSQVICANGSGEIFHLCAAAVIEPGKNAVGSRHSFSLYSFATGLFGGTYRAVPPRISASAIAHDIEGIAAAVDNNTRLIFLCSPNNPTGAVIPEEKLRWLLGQTPEDVLVVLDQAYGEYADTTASFDVPAFFDGAALISEYPNLLVSGTFSKIFGLASLRVGYGLASEEIIRRLHRLKLPFNTNGPAQQAALAALSDNTFLTLSRETNRASRALLCAGLTQSGIEFCEPHGNFICMKNPSGRNIARLMERNGIIIRELDSFGLPDFVRITIPAEAAAQKIIAILEEWEHGGAGAWEEKTLSV